jgi:uncharacterized membrane protein (UPF0127 family)
MGEIEIADSFVRRGLGLIGRSGFGKHNGLLLKNTGAIHTFFVRFPIDVVFLDKDSKILKIVENLKPFCFSPIVWKAKHTLELPQGSIKKHSLKVGSHVDLS